MASNTSSNGEILVCVEFPPKVNSIGILGTDGVREHEVKADQVMSYSLPRLELEIVLIFVLSQVCHLLLKRAKTPIFVSHMIAGLIVGFVMHEIIPEGDKNKMSSSESNAIVMGSMAAFGYSLYMFINGVKMNVSMIKKAGTTSISIGILPVLIPMLILPIFKIKNNKELTSSTMFVATTYSLTSFPVIADLLRHLKIINSELGRLALSGALVGDLLSLFFFTASALLRMWKDMTDVSQVLINHIIIISLFIVVVVLVLRPVMYWIVRNTPEGRPVKEIYVYFVMLTFLGTTFLTSKFGQFLLFGPFVLGLIVPSGPPLGYALEKKLDAMVSGLFLPLFVASATMRVVSFSKLPSSKTDIDNLPINELIVLAMLVSKFVVTMGISLYSNMPKHDALALSFIMSSKGIMDLGWYSFLSDKKLIQQKLYNLMVFTIMGIATLVPILVRIFYDSKRKYAGYRKRNIMSSTLNSELSIVACIHVPNNVTAIINLLDVSSPTRDSPISVNVLQLVKLSAQSSPIFITHQLEQHAPSKHSYSENVIFSFKQFECKHNGNVTLSAFTAISPDDMMDEDICTLALDKRASFIILPFHRRWYKNGSIESDDHAMMELNWSVFERAPCSVGILVDRGHIRRPTSIIGTTTRSTQNILMIFFGGADDREALTFAKRMAQDHMVKLTVLCIHATQRDANSASWERMLDFEVMKNVKNSLNVKYIEEEVNDGHITASLLRGMVNDYQLIIIGRRFGIDCPQTYGLKEWSEFSELGTIGDLLASTDFYSSICSVLIIQQQILSENMR
ncbi:hypothetical protein ACFE04_025557 [Oxalis oulophora]